MAWTASGITAQRSAILAIPQTRVQYYNVSDSVVATSTINFVAKGVTSDEIELEENIITNISLGNVVKGFQIVFTSSNIVVFKHDFNENFDFTDAGGVITLEGFDLKLTGGTTTITDVT